MQLTTIETTPNPNSMKLNVSQSFEKALTYSIAEIDTCPAIVAKVLRIDGVKTVFACATFMTVNKEPGSDWKMILDAVVSALGEKSNESPVSKVDGSGDGTKTLAERRRSAEKSGQVAILVQTFRGIPIQVKASGFECEKRVALHERFSSAAQAVQVATGADYLKERYWADWGVRYGALDEVTAEIVDEIEGGLDVEAVRNLQDKALQNGKATFQPDAGRSLEALRLDFKNTDWHQRLLVVQELSTVKGSLDMLIEALTDSNPQVRRLAAAALGATGNDAAVTSLCDVMLNDSAPGVRRTAGDALSDIGSEAAQPSMCQALSDANKLVRWRAARFLFEIGDESALPFLQKAGDDPEFEVRLEIEAAVERIVQGGESSLPVWKRILNDATTSS